MQFFKIENLQLSLLKLNMETKIKRMAEGKIIETIIQISNEK